MNLLQTQIPTTLVMLALAGLLFYFMIIRPARRQMAAQQTRQQELREATHPGVRVMLASGLIGTVQHVGERQVILELAPGIEVTVAKEAISKILTPEDEDFEYDDQDEQLDDQALEDELVAGDPFDQAQPGDAQWAAPAADEEQFAPVIDTEPAAPVHAPDHDGDDPASRDADRRP